MRADSVRIRTFSFQPPRNPLLRALTLGAAAILLAGLAVTGLLLGAVAVAGATLALLLRRWLRPNPRKRSNPEVIEGEFTVVSPRSGTALPRTD